SFVKNGSGILTLAGSINLPVQGGSNIFQVNNGTLSVSAGGSVTADIVQNFGTIENAGTITTDAALQTFGAATNSGEIVGTTQNFGDFINTGTMGSLQSLGGTAENSGTINGFAQNFASFTSTGIINGDIGNFGTAALEGQANGQISNQGGATVTLTGTLTGLTAYQGAGGSTIDLAGFDTTAGGVSGAGDVLLGGATLTIAAANPFTFSGVISGSGNLVKTGTDTQTLSGINSYTGTTTISGGTLVVGFGGALGAGDVIDNATLQIDNPGAFANNISGSGGLVSTTDVQLTGTVSYAGTTTIQGGTLDISGSSGTFGGGDIVNDGSLNFSRTADMVLAGNISGSGTLVMNSAGVTLTLTGENTYTGVTTNYGTLQVGDGGETGSIAGDITNNGALVFNRRGSLTYAGTISGYGSVTVAGSGTVIFTGQNLYSDTTTISGGTLRLANAQAAGSGNVALGATLSLADGVDFSNAIYVDGAAAAVEVRSGESATYSGAIYENSGASVLTKQGGGDLVLSGVTYNTGATVVAAGTLYVNGNILNSSGITVNNGATLAGSGSVTSVTVHSGGALSPGAAPGDIATLTINGSLRTESGSALGIEVADFGADQIHVTGDATLGGSVFANFASGLNLPRTPTIYTLITADGLLSGAFDGLNTLSVPTHYGATLSYDSQHAFLTIALLDNVWLATPVDSRFTNDANWSFGEMPQSDQAAVFGSSSITSVALSAEDVSLTGLIFRSGASAYSIAIDGTAAGDASLTLSSGGIVNESGNAQSITVSGTDGGTGSLVMAGGNAADSRLTANGGGSIFFSGTSDAGAGAVLTANAGGTISFENTRGAAGDYQVAAGSIAGAGTFALGDSTLTTGAINTSTTVSGEITSYGGGLVKVGTGTLTLTGANSYTGTTTISGGTLALAGGGSIAPSDVINNTVFDISATDSGATVNSLTGAGAVLLGAQTLTLSNGGNISGIISGADGGLAMDGGTLTLAGIHTYTGATTIGAGTLVLLNASGISASS
ncbi:MAG: hypothetical protein JWL71_5286, partial [Acidobacteria bacterium]|nr:hypothetical protein [Acidobacteriota bacterium]